ncbi:unnamed protein product, partial [marine sediment metagenome]
DDNVFTIIIHLLNWFSMLAFLSGVVLLIIFSIQNLLITKGKPDVNKIEPFAYIPTTTEQYQALGEVIAKAFSIGKELKVRG